MASAAGAASASSSGKDSSAGVHADPAVAEAAAKALLGIGQPDRYDFPGTEELVLNLWKGLDAFKKQLDLSKDKPEYTFYDGPPFATGLPHYGHILAGTIKDVVTRYATQTGHFVSRRFGWDCHGLPVEYEIDKKLGIRNSDDVEAMGIAAYNEECRAIVTRYTKEWETIVTRLGRWIDFRNDYKTMEPWYMESVWNVFQRIFDRKLVYRGSKIMPYSTTCHTPLSNFEAGLNYKDDTRDPAVVVAFNVVGEENTAFVAWTTTPWTLPSNLALCVNPAFTYLKVKDLKRDRFFIIGEAALNQLYPKYGKKKYVEGSEFEVVTKYLGSDLVGKRYEPLFPYFKDHPDAFRVLSDDYVTNDAGTCVVHQAPGFGEDDYRVCMEHGVIKKGGALPCPLDSDGRYTSEVPDFEGIFVKDADEAIMKRLKTEGKLVVKSSIVHRYPFCWRSDTPLIYRAVPSWFVAVETIKADLVANNTETYWVPDHVKEGRFHNWLEGARDWCISRTRYWGTPIPLWVSDDGEEVVCVGSIEELERLSGRSDLKDLHRHFVDDITIPSRKGKGVLRRIPEVFDCWFESGSMPYASVHYPFENKEGFEKHQFPADFIAEGLDQTRGWFYTLMVLSTALFNKPAFKNLVVNGLVLAEDGKKMSKRLKNYPDPALVINEFGADALRLYLINSPVVRAEPLRFAKAGVQGVIRNVFLPWYNAFRFFMQQTTRLEADTGTKFAPNPAAARASTNDMDRWIWAEAQTLIKTVRKQMEAYKLYAVVPRLVSMLDLLTNWYVRLNRNRLKGERGVADTAVALAVLYEVLMTMVRLMAPVTPFLTEYMYQHLRNFHPGRNSTTEPETAVGRAESVHFLSIPEFEEVDRGIMKAVRAMRTVVQLGRKCRERRTLNLKTPLRDVLVVNKDQAVLDHVVSLSGYICDELNTLKLNTSTDVNAWTTLRVDPNNAVLGSRLGKQFGAVRKALSAATPEDVATFQATGKLQVAGHELSGDDLRVQATFKGDTSKYEGDSLFVQGDGITTVVLNVVIDDELRAMALGREVSNRVQKLRKRAGLKPTDVVDIYVSVGELKPEHVSVPPALEVRLGDLPDIPIPEPKPAAGDAATAAPAGGAGAGAGAGAEAAAAPAHGGKGKGKGKGQKGKAQGGKKGGQKKGGQKKGQGNKKKKGQDNKKGQGKKAGGGGGAGGGAGAGAGAAVSEDAQVALKAALASQALVLAKKLRSALVPLALMPPAAVVLDSDESDVGGAAFTVTITAPSLHFASDKTFAAFKLPAIDVAQYVGCMDRTRVLDDLRTSGGLDVVVNGVAAALKVGTHVFLSAVDAYKADAGVRAAWAADGYAALGDAYAADS